MRRRAHAHGIAALADKRNKVSGSRRCKRRRRQPPKYEHAAPKISVFDWLPDELVLAILAVLGDLCSLASWAQTSRRHYALADDPSLWRRLCESRFGPLLHLHFGDWAKSWRWLYRAQAHEAATMGTDVGAMRVRDHDCTYVYWGDCLDGLPHGYGLALQMPTRHCDQSRGLTRTRTDPVDAPMETDVGYEGEWNNGQCDGRGTYTWPGGDYYTGQWKNDHYDGHGIYMFPEDGTCYEGQWSDNQHNGHGTYTWANGNRYEGGWKDNKRNGHGACTWANGERYEGGWKDDRRNGSGACTYPDAGRYEGNWDNGQRSGFGAYMWADGAKYEGDWKRNRRNGEGLLIEVAGVRYSGHWVDDHRHGHGVCAETDGSRYDGQWQHDQRHGIGTEHYIDGSSVRGRWWHKRMVSAEVTRHRRHSALCRLDSVCMACAAVAALQATP
ncbi:Morn repeat domain containing protein [Pandoravirus salinus]|uniref:Morn repeat domain containing protein n=1 Tax=Pandoravirus salinus TaxID=1349410 RepID=S4W2U3_9VIRU|nr:morn repeat domain [Pandoravirus salinus]AGO84877.1 Morn repeat domain containing protein [Pandoravirus salinus]